MHTRQIGQPDVLDVQMRATIGKVGRAGNVGYVHGVLEAAGARGAPGVTEVDGMEAAEAGAWGRISGPFCPQPARTTAPAARKRPLARIRVRFNMGKL
jgi:hypothetical protein